MPPWECPCCRCILTLPGGGDSLACDNCGWTLRRRGRRWASVDACAPAGFDAAARDRLIAMETHFWSRERRLLVQRLLARLGASGGCAAELGCGTGSMLPLLEDRHDTVVAVDAHEPLLDLAETASHNAILVQGDVCRTPVPDSSCALVVALDVIEHVDPDDLLREARRMAAPRGLLLMSAPAAPTLWSRMDEAAGHRCRYDRPMMDRELRRNGWTPLHYTFYQSLLFPVVWARSRLGLRTGHDMERHPPAWLDRLLGGITRLEGVVPNGHGFPFGTSLFACARAEEP